jgi:hypothetical protein
MFVLATVADFSSHRYQKRGVVYMIAGECLALEDDLVSAVDVRAVEGRHEEVEVGR